MKGLSERIILTAMKAPENIAIEFSDQIINYGTLTRRVYQIASCFIEKNIFDEKILFLHNKNIALITNILGVIHSGNIFVPLHHDWPQNRLKSIINNLDAHYIITEAEYIPRIVTIAKELSLHMHIFVDEMSGDINSIAGNNINDVTIEKIKVNNEQPMDVVAERYNDKCYIIHTSGSTADAKEIVGSQESVIHFIEWEVKEFSVNRHTRISMLTAMTFDVVLRDIFVPLLAGGTLCIPEESIIYNPNKLLEWLETAKISLTHMVPTLFREVTSLIVSPQCLPECQYILLAGEVLTGSDVSKFVNIFHDRIKLTNLYGPSETCLAKFFYHITDQDCVLDYIPVGYPLPKTEALIYTYDRQQCPPGEEGEIYINTSYSSYGYYNISLNSGNFINLNDNKALYKTGDCGCFREDGALVCMGRLDNQVKIRGMKVNLSEVESLINAFPQVRQSAVVIRKTDTGEKMIVAYYLAADEMAEQIYAHLCNNLPYYMVPSFIIRKKNLPTLVNGKTDRKTLEKQLIGIAEQDEVTINKPITDLQKVLHRIWTEVLLLPRIGIDQDFFRSGGHSLKAARLAYKINHEFNVRMSVPDIFSNRTILAQEQYLVGADRCKSLPILHAVNRSQYTVSEVQRRICLASISQDDKTLYNMPSALHIRGPLNVKKINEVMQKIFDRHDSLRTIFNFTGNNLVQEIRYGMVVPFEYITNLAPLKKEIGSRHKQIRKELLINKLLKKCIEPLNLENGCLFYSKLLQIGPEEYLLFWDMHHCIADGVSEEIIKHELASLYNDLELPEVAYQYKDYVEWSAANDSGKAIDYWLNELRGGDFALKLPRDFPRKKSNSHMGGRVRSHLEKSLCRKLHRLAEEEQVTLFSILLAAFYILLHYYTNQEDITIGTIGAGREEAAFENTVGVFIRLFALRNCLTWQEDICQFIRRIFKKTTEMTKFYDFHFEELLNALKIIRRDDHQPLIEVLFILQNMDMVPVDIKDLEVIPVEVERENAKYDLTLYAIPRNENIILNMEYSSEVFKPQTVEVMMDSYQNILRQICELPKRNLRIEELSLLTEVERTKIESRSNKPLVEAQSATINEMFRKSVVMYLNNTAVRYHDKLMTYQELDIRSDHLAKRLIQGMVVKGTVIGIMLPRGMEMLVAILAILKLGCAYLPIDPSYPKHRIRYMLEHSRCSLLVMDQSDPFEAIRVININDYQNKVHADDSRIDPICVSVAPNDLAYVIYTSGSTGNPKGVMIEHRNVVNFIEAMCMEADFSSGRKIVCLTTISFDIFVLETLLPLTQGMEVVVADEEEQMDISKLSILFFKHGIDILQITPSRLNMFMADKEARSLLRGIKTFLIGGEPVKEGTVNKLKGIRDDIEIYNVYGPTETCVWSTIKKINFDEPINIGHAIKNTRIYILNKQLTLVPDNVIGDLYIGGEGVSRGYLNNPELTAQRFIVNPFIEGELIYCTGDKARWNHCGEIEFIGRDDNQAKVRGYRIELTEIEECILKKQSIRNCVCVIKKSSEYEASYILAYYDSEHPLDKQELYQQLKAELPLYMIPLDFIYLADFPMTSNGKADRKAVGRLNYLTITSEKTKPLFSNQIQEDIYMLWKNLLGGKDFSLDDNFFEIGGNSMLLVQTFQSLRDRCESLTIAELFINPTVRLISTHIHTKYYANICQRVPVPSRFYSNTGSYRPFIHEERIDKELFCNLQLMCQETMMSAEEVMFAVFAFLSAQIFEQRKFSIQCLVSDDQGEECSILLEDIDGIQEIMARVSAAYHNRTPAYRLPDVVDNKERAIYISFAYNQKLPSVNLLILDFCLCIEYTDTYLTYKFIINTGKLKRNYWNKIGEVFKKGIINLINKQYQFIKREKIENE